MGDGELKVHNFKTYQSQGQTLVGQEKEVVVSERGQLRKLAQTFGMEHGDNITVHLNLETRFDDEISQFRGRLWEQRF
jgi:hypothetical protein